MSEAFEAVSAREPSAKYIVQRASPLNRGFELLATAPRGAAELRALVLALAIRGLLESQETSDQPASALLVDILTAKDRVIADGRLRPDKLAAQLTCADQPFAVPASWVWARFGAVSINRDGERVPVSSEDRQPRAKLFDYYGASGVIDKIDGYIFDKTLLLIGEDGANLINRATPIAFLASGKYWVNNHAHVIDATHPGLMEYLCLFINAISLEPYITGTAQPKMNQAKLNSIPVALPPLAEQRRIVARVDELMKLCDALEQSGRLADVQHARLTSALFDALAASASAHALAENWQRIAAHFDLLLDRPEAIDALEQTILQLAVRGLLVPQVASDRPTRIATLKPEVAEAPYEVPLGWAWRTVESIATVGSGTTPSRTNAKYFDPPEVPWVTSGETGQPFIAVTAQAVSGLALRETTLKVYPIGALIVAMYGQGKTRGQIAELLLPATTNQACAAIVPTDPTVHHRRYIKLFFEKSYDELRSESVGGAQPNLNVGKIKSTLIPLPPLAEQHRIVARVEELRRLCAQLRERLTEARRTQSQLADALVAKVD